MVVGSLLSALLLLSIAAVGTFPLLFAAFIMRQISALPPLGGFEWFNPDVLQTSSRWARAFG